MMIMHSCPADTFYLVLTLGFVKDLSEEKKSVFSR